MYAVIKTGGKQYKVAAGEKLKIEQIPQMESSIRTYPLTSLHLGHADLSICLCEMWPRL